MERIARTGSLIVSAALVALAGCGGSGVAEPPPQGLSQDVSQGLYVICSGKPRYCSVADLRSPHPEWKSATELTGAELIRFRRLVGPTPAPGP